MRKIHVEEDSSWDATKEQRVNWDDTAMVADA